MAFKLKIHSIPPFDLHKELSRPYKIYYSDINITHPLSFGYWAKLRVDESYPNYNNYTVEEYICCSKRLKKFCQKYRIRHTTWKYHQLVTEKIRIKS